MQRLLQESNLTVIHQHENADNIDMNNNIFSDTIFILNMRIRMINDTLKLNPDPELFLDRSMDDIEFIDRILSYTAQKLMDNIASSNDEYDNVLDAEWQFNQLLTEFSLDTCPFSVRAFPKIQDKINSLRISSSNRRKTLEETGISSQAIQVEPVTSSAEMSGLLGGA